MEFKDVIDNIPKGAIRKSLVHGFGLFAKERIEDSECLGYLDGQRVNWDLYDARMKEQGESDLFVEWNALSEDTLLVRPFRTKYSYINHARTPNAVILNDPMRVVALRVIEQDEEIFLDYRKEQLRKDYLEGHGKTYL